MSIAVIRDLYLLLYNCPQLSRIAPGTMFVRHLLP